MNYVPGTASLIDDIDSKIRAERGGLDSGAEAPCV